MLFIDRFIDDWLYDINTTIKITSACDGDARSVGGRRGWLAGDTDGLAGWPAGRRWVTVGVVSQPAADAERYRCTCVHCIQGLAGRGAASSGGVLVTVNQPESGCRYKTRLLPIFVQILCKNDQQRWVCSEISNVQRH